MQNPYTQKEQLSEGVYVLEDGNRSWGGELNHNFELLNKSLVKKDLTISLNGSEIGSYNTENETDIDIKIDKITNNDIDSLF